MSHDTTLCPVRHALAVDQVLVEHERLVHWVVHQQWLGALSYGAAVQAGRLALWQAVQGYDAHAAWRSAAMRCRPSSGRSGRRWRLRNPRQVRCYAPTRRRPGPTPSAPFGIDWWRDGARSGGATAGTLATVIVAHYGLADGAPQTFEAIGQALASPVSGCSSCTSRRCSGWPTRRTPWLAPASGTQHGPRLPGLPGPASVVAPAGVAMSTALSAGARSVPPTPISCRPSVWMRSGRIAAGFPGARGHSASPKHRYRSHYRYLGYAELADAAS